MISNEPKSHVRMLDVDVNKELNIPDIYEKIIRTGTVGEGSCFFHSVLKSLNLDGYSNMNEKAKLKYMIELRNKLSDSITINQYKNNLMNISSMRLSMELNKFLNVLYNFVEDPVPFLSEKCPKSANFLGEIVDDNIKVFKFINSVLSITDFEKVIDNPIITSSINIDMYIENFGKVLYSSFLKEIEEIGANVEQDKLDICKIQINKFTKNISNFIVNNQLEKYKAELKKTNEWASDVMFGLLADYLDIDIYFININSKTVIPYDHVSKGDRHSVVVGWINDVHFENIAINEGKFIKRVFEPNHPFILKIKEKINQEKKQLPLLIKELQVEDSKDTDFYNTIDFRLKDQEKKNIKQHEDSEEDSSIKIIKDVPGLFYIDNAISKEYSKELYRDINKGEWDPVSKSPNSRKVQQYGYKYDYKRRAVAEKGPPIPSYLYQLIKSLKSYIKKLKLKDLDFNQVIINKYEPGQGISKHTDAKDYGPIIGCYTIESGSTMKFNKDDKSSSLYVKPNSLYIMSGDSRYKWDHEMPSTKSDRVDGKRIPRDQRISITFRNVPVE
jgi:alkylated DNA repair dioxygenase AlkB